MDYQVQKSKSDRLEQNQRINNLSKTVQKQSKEKVKLEQKVKDLKTEKKKKVKCENVTCLTYLLEDFCTEATLFSLNRLFSIEVTKIKHILKV